MRSPLGPSRRHLFVVGLLLWLIGFFFYVSFHTPTPTPSPTPITSSEKQLTWQPTLDWTPEPVLPIFSLASSLSRIDHELPATLKSLLNQDTEFAEIRLYFSLDEQKGVRERLAIGDLSDVFLEPKVNIQFVEDDGPGTKFLRSIEEFLDRGAEENQSFLIQKIVVVDDDHIYSPAMLRTLLDAHERIVKKKGDAVVGLRGWRVRKDLHWGVGPEDLSRHVIEAHNIAQDYQVGVVTANEGYLVLPRYFMPGALLPPIAIYPPFDWYSLSCPLFNYSSAPLAAHLVDDIWLSGNLASLSVPRYVVPLPPPTPPSIDITLTHPLERHMLEHKISRARANDEVIAYFKSAWEEEDLYFEMNANDERKKRRGPKLVGGLSRLRSWWARQWFQIKVRWRQRDDREIFRATRD